jgi:copper homeostasis protein
MSFQLEICCFNLPSAMIAQKAGADRIEFCGDPAEGGITPSFGMIRVAREKVIIPLYPIIRPRGGDFLYTDEEFEVMENDVLQCRELGCDGVVFGILNRDGSIDKRRCAILREKAFPLGVTFHRAFDWATNPFEALEDIVEIGCERILTSGQRPTAMEGTVLIDELVRQAGNRISIMPGSGIRAENILQVAEKTHAEEFHSSAGRRCKSTMQFINSAMLEQPYSVEPDPAEILSMHAKLSELYTTQRKAH